MSLIKLDALHLPESFDDLQKVIIDYSTPNNLLLATFGISASYILYKIVRFYLKRRKYRNIPGPPANGILGFFFGNIFEMKKEMDKGKILPDLMVKWHETYGEVYKFQMFSEIIVVTSDKNTIKEGLITKNFPKDKSLSDRITDPFGKRFVGRGLASELDYDSWKERRAAFNPGFHRHVLITFVDHFNQIVNTLSEKLRARADNKTKVYLLNEINRATLDAIALIAFGMNTDSVNVEDSTLNNYLTKILNSCYNNLMNPFFQYQPSKLGEVKEAKNMIEHIREIGRNKILERVNAFKNNEHMPEDILSSILSNYKDKELDLELMTDDFVTFFVAGQETTANTLAFSFLELARKPEIVKKAREEIDRVLGERTEVTFQDVNELKYCSAIFKETLRLYPPGTHVMRITPEDIDVNGTKVPKDTHIWFSTYVNGRYEKYFKNPLEYKPERFLKTGDSDETTVNSYIYLPFSLGPRNCIGQNFAQLEGVIVLAKLLQKFDFRLDPTQSLDAEQTLTLKPKDGTQVFVSLRK